VPGVLAPVVGLVIALAAGCSSAPPAPAPSTAPTASASARMVCEPEAQRDLAQALGVAPIRPPSSTWVDAVFTCRYEYPSAVLVLSVTELADAHATDSYLASLRSGAASPHDVPGLGQQAFTVADGSAYVRKDTKVLHVDVTGLPDPFGHPSRNRVATALTVAEVIMLCWTGA
jgi:hypothetical protein